jgi:predicted proteasome-type protease
MVEKLDPTCALALADSKYGKIILVRRIFCQKCLELIIPKPASIVFTTHRHYFSFLQKIAG